jgi:hypothetical protein
MKILIAMLAAASVLSGCVGYAAPYPAPSASYPTGPAYGSAPVYRGDDARPRYHDRDRDGVPDRVDRDRDGDGVPNRRDNRPNNPYRY